MRTKKKTIIDSHFVPFQIPTKTETTTRDDKIKDIKSIKFLNLIEHYHSVTMSHLPR